MVCLFGKLKIPCAVLTAALLLAIDQPTIAQISWKREPAPTAPLAAAPRIQADPQIATAALQAPAQGPLPAKPPQKKDHRLLARPTSSSNALPKHPRQAAPASGLPKIESFATAGAGLGIVIGLFLVCMWMLRRSSPQPTSPLPPEVASVLGRMPLAARNFAQLLQMGNKLVLFAITPEGVSPITEVTDPVEVQRLLGLCQRNQKQSTTAEFHNVLEQLAQEPASGFLGNEAATSYARQNKSSHHQ